MAELISGLICCDTVSYTDQDDGKQKYKMQFNPGRLTGALILAGLGIAGRIIW